MLAAASFVALALLSRPAEADSFTWSHIAGTGSYKPSFFSPLVDFSTADAVLTISYDLYIFGIRRGLLRLSLPDLGVDVVYQSGPAFYHFPGGGGIGVAFSAENLDSGYATAVLTGDPGPLDRFGNPLSLEGMLGNPVAVDAHPPNAFDLTFFSSRPVPEPSALLMLALGIGGVSLACAGRCMKRRPAQPRAARR
jgi:hypothetical protein